MDLTESHNKENYSLETAKDPIPLLDAYLAEPITIEQIELPYENSTYNDDEDPIDPSYAMDFIVDIMNLLYTLEKKYPIQSSFLTNPALGITTTDNGSAIRPWRLTAKHRIILVGWLIQLFYARFHLSQDALHMYEYNTNVRKVNILVLFRCIGLLDRFLQKSITSNGFVTQKNLQLIAVATFLIAAKFEVRFN